MRTLYDKIDDQNMFLTAQLSRHQEDMEGFYTTICEQNDELKHLLEKTDFSKVQKIKRFWCFVCFYVVGCDLTFVDDLFFPGRIVGIS